MSERRRDFLQHRAESCGCGQCRKAYERHMERVEDDEMQAINIIAHLSMSWLLTQDPDHKQFWVDPEGDGEIVWAYPGDEANGRMFIDLDEVDEEVTDE